MMFVRSAGERDLPAIRALLVETWHATYDSIYGAERVIEITDDWHSIPALLRRLAAPQSELLVADDGAEIGGMAFASARDEGRTVVLHQLYVKPARQGCGIGGLLLDEILSSFHDAERVRLEVEEKNAGAIAFYLAQGFVAVGRTADCGASRSGIPALVLERAIASA